MTDWPAFLFLRGITATYERNEITTNITVGITTNVTTVSKTLIPGPGKEPSSILYMDVSVIYLSSSCSHTKWF